MHIGIPVDVVPLVSLLLINSGLKAVGQISGLNVASLIIFLISLPLLS